MTQNSIIDSDFPSGILFPARCSPIVCAADMLHILLRLPYHIIAGASPPEAARRVVRERSRRPVRNGAGEATANSHVQGEEEEPLTFGNQHPRAHTVVFVLGVLPQAVKLFGMRGIPWTQVWGGLYFSSFLVIAGVGALARFGGNDNLTVRAKATLGERKMKTIRLAVVVGHVGMWYWLVYILLDSVPAKPVMSTPGAFGLMFLLVLKVFGSVLLFALSVFLLMLLVVFSIFFAVRGFLRLFAISLPPDPIINCALFVIMPLGWLGLEHFKFIFLNERYGTLMVPWMLAALVIAIAPPYILMIFFALVNLVLSILYYRFRYDQTGTVKSPWADKLG
jgi:hypothetical protein